MAYVITNEKSDKTEKTACLSKTDCLVLRPAIEEKLFTYRKQYERLHNRYESGSATEDQIKAYQRAKLRYDSLLSTILAIEDVIKE